MRGLILIAIHLGAFLVPFSELQGIARNSTSVFPGWPAEFEGAPLIRLQMTEQERGFSEGFPGRIARLTDGSREIIFRYIERPSRQLHPSADCLRGSGYQVETQPISRDKNSNLWGCVLASRDGVSYKICERIYDRENNSWYDVSSWFWAALLGNSEGPWWAVTVAERVYLIDA